VSEPAPPPAASPGPPPAPRRGRGLVWTLRIGGGLAALLLLLLLSRGFVVRHALETVVESVTGFPLEIADVSIGLTNGRVEVTDLRLMNPPGFEDPRCLHVSRLVADAEVGSFLRDVYHAEEIDLVIPEIVVVKNAAGETNLDRLSALAGKDGDGPAAGEEPAKAEPGKDVRWRCDLLHLSIGRVVFLDYTRMRDGKPKRDTWDLDIDEEFRDLTSPEQVVRLIVLKVVAGTPIRLVNATVETLKEGLGGVVGVAGDLLKGAGGAIKGAAEGIGGAIEGIFGGGKKKEEPPPPAPPPGEPKRKRR
jgi:hypothetical protein